MKNNFNLELFRVQKDNPITNSKNGAKRPCSGNKPDIEPTTCIDLLGTKMEFLILTNEE